MSALISAVTLVVPDYDEAISFYVGTLGFDLIEDTQLSETKRWVRIAPKGGQTALLLAKADGERQIKSIGNQTGGRVAFFLQTENFMRDYQDFASNGVRFLEKPRFETYGMVAVFSDPFGNLWDLIEPK